MITKTSSRAAAEDAGSVRCRRDDKLHAHEPTLGYLIVKPGSSCSFYLGYVIVSDRMEAACETVRGSIRSVGGPVGGPTSMQRRWHRMPQIPSLLDPTAMGRGLPSNAAQPSTDGTQFRCSSGSKTEQRSADVL